MVAPSIRFLPGALKRRRQGKPAQRAGEGKERQRYRTRLEAEAGGATKEELATERRCEAEERRVKQQA